MNKLILRRFKNLDNLKKYMNEDLNLKVKLLFFSESERLENLDFMIDGELENGMAFTIYYLKDNEKNIIITEV